MQRILLSACLLAFAAPAHAADYLGSWQSGRPEVAKALIKGGARGCGEFYQKPHKSFTNEWLVACSRDGKTFTAYRVWPNIGRAQGPVSGLLEKEGGAPRR